MSKLSSPIYHRKQRGTWKEVLVLLLLLCGCLLWSVDGYQYHAFISNSFSSKAKHNPGGSSVFFNIASFTPGATGEAFVTFTAVNQLSDYVLTSGYGFGSVQGLRYLPDSATLTGYVVTLNAVTDRSQTDRVNWYSLGFFVGTTKNGEKTNSPVWGGKNPASYSYGSQSDKWGSTLVVSDWKTSTAGVGFRIRCANTPPNPTAYVDWVTLALHYTISVGVASVSPSSEASLTAALSGGQLVTIVLNGPLSLVTLSQDIKCRFGSAQGTVELLSSANEQPSYIQCRSPTQSSFGSYRVSITLNNVDYTTENVMYTYSPVTCTPSCVHGSCSLGVCYCDSGYGGSACADYDCSLNLNCGGHGQCTGPNTCTCDAGYTGSSCTSFSCGIENCNGHGFCSGPNTCTCNSGWTGPACTQFTCDSPCTAQHSVCVGPNSCACEIGWGPGYPSCSTPITPDCSGLSDCSSHGECIGIDVCDCDAGYGQADCSQPLCPNRNDCTSPVNGQCVQPDVCQCNDGYTGSECERFDCSGLAFCGAAQGRGSCTGPNTCTCTDGYALPNCSTPICTNCSFLCVAPEDCQCPPGTIPPLCITPEAPSCANANNCSNRGVCKGADICICIEGWTDFACDKPICDINKCVEGQGRCVAPEVCECEVGWKGIQCEVPDVPPEVVTEQNSISGGAIAAAVIVPLLVLAVAGVVAWWFVTRKLRYAGRPRPIEPKYQFLVYGEWMERIAFSFSSSTDTRTFLRWQTFEQLLLQKPDFPLIDFLIESTASSDHDELSRNLLFAAEFHGLTTDLFVHLIRTEVANTTELTSLFRANSFATKMFRTYSKMHGLKYLFSVLALPIIELKEQTQNERLSVEIDPNKMEEGEDEATNRWQLLLLVQKLFTSLRRSASAIPGPLRNLSQIIRDEVAVKFPQAVNKSLGAFWFLRFYCPAIVAPHAYGLLSEPPSAAMQRQLVLLSKILQNLANEQTFGKKESGMEKLNDFIEENQQGLVGFFDSIAERQEVVDTIEIPTKVRLNSLCYLHEFISAVDLTNLQEPLKGEVKKALEQLGEPAVRIRSEKS